MRNVLLFAAIVVGSFALSIWVCIPILNPSPEDIQQLFVFMVGSGGLTVGIAAALRYSGVFERLRSLRWSLLVSIILLVVLVFVNVYLTAQLMFISQHDLALTTSLLIFAGIIGAVAVWFAAQPIIQRLKQISDAVKRIGAGDLDVRLAVRGNDELAQLTVQFNHMVQDLRQLEDQKRQLERSRRDLIAWISHDLRTPLTAIRVMHEAILDGVADDPETVARYIRNSQREVNHLNQLIDDLFTLSRIDIGQLQLKKAPTYLPDLISDTISSLSAQAELVKVQLKGEVNTGVDTVQAAPEKIQRVLYNLLDNALRYAAPQSVITIGARPAGPEVHITVHNIGALIPVGELPHVFDRFFQGEPSRGPSINGRRGAGLGLAIARAFVEAHGGRIWAESTPEYGTRFTFSLPMNL